MFEIEKGDSIKDVALYGDYLLMLRARKLLVCDIINDRIHKEYNFGGAEGRSLIFEQSSFIIVVAMNMSSFAKIGSKNWSFSYIIKENHFELIRKHWYLFYTDERYVAALYEPGLIPPHHAKSWGCQQLINRYLLYGM